MKRLVALGVASAMAISLTACGARNPSGSNSTGDNTTQVYLFISNRDEWNTLMEQGALECGIDGVEVFSQNAESDANKQLQQVETAINAGADALVVQLADAETLPEIKELADGIPLVFVNRVPTNEELYDENTIYIGCDEATAGYAQAEYLTTYFKEKGTNDFSYLLLSGMLGTVSATRRTDAVLERLEENGMVATEATAPLVCDWDRATAMDNVSPLLGVTDFDCIIANNDAMALGAVEALEQAGIEPGDIPIVGIDATGDACSAIADGKMACSAYQAGEEQGRAAIQAAYNMIQGREPSEGINYKPGEANPYILSKEFEMVTAENVDQFIG